MSPPLVILEMGSPLPAVRQSHGEFHDWILQGMSLEPSRAAVIDAPVGETPPPPEHCSAVVITGSEAMVTDHPPWLERLVPWLRELVQARVPVLGICFGHQWLADVFGGTVDYDPRGREFGRVEFALTDAGSRDPLLLGLSSDRSFAAYEAHRQSVLRPPPDAQVLAVGRGGICQAMRIGSAVGVQFHPEFTAPVVEAYARAMSTSLIADGLDPSSIIARLAEPVQGGGVLGRFFELAIESVSKPGAGVD